MNFLTGFYNKVLDDLAAAEKRADEAERERDAFKGHLEGASKAFIEKVRELLAERDEARETIRQMMQSNAGMAAERNEARSSLARVVEALKPFADLADHPLCQGWKDWQPLWAAGRDEDNARIMFSDIRKARSALHRSQGE